MKWEVEWREGEGGTREGERERERERERGEMNGGASRN